MKYLLMMILLLTGCAKQKTVETPSITNHINDILILSNKINTPTYTSNIFPFTNNRNLATEPPLYSCRGLISDLTDEQIDTLVATIKSGDYSVLIPFMSRDLIQPESKILNEYYSYTTNEFEPKELTYTLSQAGKTITYINQYGFLFINSKEILWDLNDVASIYSYSEDKSTFYSLMEKVFASEDPQEIIDLYNDYNPTILDCPFPSINITVYELFGNINNLVDIDEQATFYYLFPILYPSKEEQRIYLINYMLNDMFIFNGIEWTIYPPPRIDKK